MSFCVVNLFINTCECMAVCILEGVSRVLWHNTTGVDMPFTMSVRIFVYVCLRLIFVFIISSYQVLCIQ